MHAVVVYESHWGNTAAIAKAIAAGLGPDTRVLTTDEADGPALADVDLLVAGAPVIAFGLASDKVRKDIANDPSGAPTAPDVSHESMKSWLERVPPGTARAAAFETRMRWSPGGATGAISRGLGAAGYRPIHEVGRFVVKGKFGPLREGELEKARRWGANLATAVGATE